MIRDDETANLLQEDLQTHLDVTDTSHPALRTGGGVTGGSNTNVFLLYFAFGLRLAFAIEYCVCFQTWAPAIGLGALVPCQEFGF